MAFDFPASPTEGQVFSPAGGPSFVYRAPAWRQVTTTQAIQLATAETRNRLVNGALQHSQQNGDTVVSAHGGGYPADQWVGYSGIAGFDTARNGTSNPAQMYLRGQKASLAAGDIFFIYQNLEGTQIKDFMWGSASAKQVILRFDAYTTTAGTYSVSIRNFDGSRTFLATFTSPVASTWKTNTIVIPGDSVGTWVNTTAAAMIVGIASGIGSTYLGTAGWQAGNKLGVTGMTNGHAAATQYLYVRNLGLYMDPNNTGVAPPWQEPDYGEELRACQRYWTTMTISLGGAGPNNYTMHSFWFPVEMRITPAVTNLVAGSIGGTPTIQGDGPSNNRGGYVQIHCTAAGFYVLNRVNAYSARM